MARNVIHQLANDKGVLQACMAKGRLLAARAKAIDPTADITVTPDKLVVNGLERVVAIVENHSPTAVKHEYGGAFKLGADGAAWRPMGRAADQLKE